MTLGGTRLALSPRLAGALFALAVALTTTPSHGEKEGVANTLHNLSVSGPGEIRSPTETQVCKFCHVPHNAVEPVPLWGHTLSRAQYEVPDLRQARAGAEPAPQPDGSSRLCLSCHDGTVALGDVAGEADLIPLAGGDHLRPGRKGFLGTDLTGSHPVSFQVPDGDLLATTDLETDMGLVPLSVIELDVDVKLDADGKMQCTTCHDAHSDRFYAEGKVPRFWVKPTVEEVCLTCHALR